MVFIDDDYNDNDNLVRSSLHRACIPACVMFVVVELVKIRKGKDRPTSTLVLLRHCKSWRRVVSRSADPTWEAKIVLRRKEVGVVRCLGYPWGSSFWI